MHNVTAEVQTLVVNLSTLELCHRGEMRDIISGTAYTVKGDALRLEVAPYQVLWLQ